MKYVAFLRGINVSGQKKIKMQDLRDVLELSKLKNVHTYIQSGNIFFESDACNGRTLESEIQSIILDHFGYQVQVMVRTPQEINNIMGGIPFDGDISKIYITLFSEVPNVELVEAIDCKKYLPEQLIVKDKVAYFYAANGAARSKMNNNFVESKLKVHGTTRNFNTMTYVQNQLNT